MTQDHPDQQHGPLISLFPFLFCIADIKADFCAMTPSGTSEMLSNPLFWKNVTKIPIIPG